MGGEIEIGNPMSGRISITSAYGQRIDPKTGDPKTHGGVDMRAAVGDPIYAAADGKVIRTKFHKDFGNVVVIDHGSGLLTLYAHLSDDSMAVKVGDRVARGRLLALAGNTGRSFGPHLHFELRNLKPGEELPKDGGLLGQGDKIDINQIWPKDAPGTREPAEPRPTGFSRVFATVLNFLSDYKLMPRDTSALSGSTIKVTVAGDKIVSLSKGTAKSDPTSIPANDPEQPDPKAGDPQAGSVVSAAIKREREKAAQRSKEVLAKQRERAKKAAAERAKREAESRKRRSEEDKKRRAEAESARKEAEKRKKAEHEKKKAADKLARDRQAALDKQARAAAQRKAKDDRDKHEARLARQEREAREKRDAAQRQQNELQQQKTREQQKIREQQQRERERKRKEDEERKRRERKIKTGPKPGPNIILAKR